MEKKTFYSLIAVVLLVGAVAMGYQKRSEIIQFFEQRWFIQKNESDQIVIKRECGIKCVPYSGSAFLPPKNAVTDEFTAYTRDGQTVSISYLIDVSDSVDPVVLKHRVLKYFSNVDENDIDVEELKKTVPELIVIELLS